MTNEEYDKYSWQRYSLEEKDSDIRLEQRSEG